MTQTRATKACSNCRISFREVTREVKRKVKRKDARLTTYASAMRSATEPPENDLELFRSVRSDQVLRGCGDVFREKDEYTASAGALPRHVTTRLLGAMSKSKLAS